MRKSTIFKVHIVIFDFIRTIKRGLKILMPQRSQKQNTRSVAQLCPTLCDPRDCSPTGSSVHEIFQARILEWVAISFFTGYSSPRDQTCMSCIACRFVTTVPPADLSSQTRNQICAPCIGNSES